MKKIIFLGSKPIGYFCLKHIIDKSKEFDIKIVAVFSNENKRFGGASFRELCKEKNIPFYSTIDNLTKIKDPIDYLISVQFHEILKSEHLCRVKKRAVNLHMAPVPDYRGCNQFSYAIFNKEEQFGTTLHIMDKGIDSGDIIAERRFKIKPKISVDELLNQTIEESKILFVSNFDKIFDLTFLPIPQQGKGRIYFRKDIEKLKEIRLSEGEEILSLKMRSAYMSGFSPPFIRIKNEKYYLIPEKNYKQ